MTPRTLRLAIQGRDRFAGLPAPSTLRRWVALALEGKYDAAITLRFAGAREARQINRSFRRRDYATNVLTFAYTRRPELAADIVLCWPVIERESRNQDKTPRAHLAHLLIHAVLHARGFDRQARAARRRMENLEISLLSLLAIDNPYDLPRK